MIQVAHFRKIELILSGDVEPLHALRSALFLASQLVEETLVPSTVMGNIANLGAHLNEGTPDPKQTKGPFAAS